MYILGGGDDDEEKLNPEDFKVKQKEGETIVRKPGEIKGQSFTIQDLKNCTVALFDNSAQVQIDDCVNCKIFIGPCESSVFIRTCKDCQLVVSCAQFRARDCTNMDVLLHVGRGQPIIETSSDIRFGPFHGSYAELKGQLASASMSAWDTEWTNVHDFNSPGSGEKPHWSYLPSDKATSEALLGRKIGAICADITPLSSDLIPRTWGTKGLSGKAEGEVEYGFLLLGGDTPEELGNQLLEWLAEQESKEGSALPKLLRSRRKEMSRAELDSYSKLAGSLLNEAIKPGVLIGLEFAYQKQPQDDEDKEEEAEACAPLLSKVMFGEAAIAAPDSASAKKMATEFFGALRSSSG